MAQFLAWCFVIILFTLPFRVWVRAQRRARAVQQPQTIVIRHEYGPAPVQQSAPQPLSWHDELARRKAGLN